MNQLNKFIRSQEDYFGKSITSRRSFNQALLQAGVRKKRKRSTSSKRKKGTKKSKRQKEEELDDCAICLQKLNEKDKKYETKKEWKLQEGLQAVGNIKSLF